jgi:hypothetical protein
LGQDILGLLEGRRKLSVAPQSRRMIMGQAHLVVEGNYLISSRFLASKPKKRRREAAKVQGQYRQLKDQELRLPLQLMVVDGKVKRIESPLRPGHAITLANRALARRMLNYMRDNGTINGEKHGQVRTKLRHLEFDSSVLRA